MKTGINKELDLLFTHYPSLKVCEESILAAYQMLCNCYANKGLIMVCGNGGSAADSEHIVGELMKGFKTKRPLSHEQGLRIKNAFPDDAEFLIDNLQQAIPAISLVSQTSISTAFCNDVKAEMLFAQLVMGYGNSGDILIALSTTGNSKNVVNACKVAKAFGIQTIALTGQKVSKLSEICDVAIRVPAQEVFRVQELHLPVYHALCAMLEANVFGKSSFKK
ncbi:MAG: SIS domain-containing protein [Tannerella sp.]|jgi:D-sedoheptulose 7-phosphate isomerase|nr:SIS domain-containing protein [Tannerella sp.]